MVGVERRGLDLSGVGRASIFTMRGEALLATLRNEARSGHPVAAVLRHAAREEIVDPTRPELPLLTAEGHAAAEAFGASLGDFARVRLFFSPVQRCQQTAEGIARGVRRLGATAEIHGSHEALGIGYTRDRDEFGRLFELHGPHFVRLWCGGELPANVIDPADRCASEILAHIRERLAEVASTPRALDLHVSHDINIMAVREQFVGLRHEDVGWLNFLDGVAFGWRESGLRAIYRERHRELA